MNQEKMTEDRRAAFRVMAAPTTCDVETLIPIVHRMYAELGAPPPQEVHLLPSPYACRDAIEAMGGDFESASPITSLVMCRAHQYQIVERYVDLPEPIDAETRRRHEVILEMSQYASLMWFFRDHAFVAARPTQHWSDDDTPVPHRSDGPAVEWEDGHKLYFWRGVRVPASWIEDRPTLDDALRHENVEMRRIAAEIIGWAEILQEPSLHMRIIDEDPDPQIGSLVEVDLPDAPNERFLLVICGTGRVFAIPVPRTCSSALDAQAKCWDVPQDVYAALELRT